jgi:hypothetical protein
MLDPDPNQMNTDPKHCQKVTFLVINQYTRKLGRLTVAFFLLGGDKLLVSVLCTAVVIFHNVLQETRKKLVLL